ncbi:PAS domain S-box-containing protein [Rhodopirellula rubra]|uniref:histidine kinase n=1 Tax=Aporhodopirellula rubra TaxID=980271 RepID=A0A7W5H876_9BACT|nr:CHASE3 domain-containing protein [Aporhodopirellula rubra]MBB3209183.1 PAS domain S-box-containing protein [Aporhodopirellula rubra]
MHKTKSKSVLRRLSEPLGTGAVIVLLLLSGTVTLRNIHGLWSDSSVMADSQKTLDLINSLELALTKAETGQRGYIITGDETYLEPFVSANAELDDLTRELFERVKDDSGHASTFEKLTSIVSQKRTELNTTIDVRSEAGLAAARDIVIGNFGNNAMNQIRESLAKMRGVEESRMVDHRGESLRTYRVAWYTGLLTTVAGLTLVGGVMLAVHRRRETAERDAAIIQSERERLQKALDERTILEHRNRELDQHIRLFVDQIQDYAIFTMDTDCRATSWNSGVLKVLGFTEEEFLGRDVRPLIFTPEANQDGTTEREFATAAATGSASDDRWMMRKDRARFWAAGMTSSIRDEADALIGYSKVMRDMTHQKLSSDEMARLAAELSEESRRKNEFLATLAHELRNPLSPIKNAVQLMGMMQLDAEVEDLRFTMERQADQLVRLIDDLMDISRIGRGKIELKKQVVEIATIINSAVESSQSLIDANRQTLDVDVPDAGLCVNVDPARITQVVCNLLNNASKYSNENCSIVLSVVQEEEDVVIRVKDNGNGIAPMRLEDIFEMFSQVGDSVERGTAGLGIGLTLVRTLVELHGGTVAAYSEGVGKGSEFTVALPAASPDEAPEVATLVQRSPEPSRSYRVLVVEDMRALAIIMSRLLTKLGHHVEVVESGVAAIEKLQDYDAEVIFSDISMPGMTGYDLARKLRATDATKGLHLVAMTGYGQLSDREKALKAGFDEHMVKPVDIAKLQQFFASLTMPDNVSSQIQ